MPLFRTCRSVVVGALPCATMALYLLLSPASSMAQANAPGDRPCAAIDKDRSQALPNTIFDVALPPFGKVCFLGRYQPLPGDPDHSKIIGFELWRDGVLAYRLPRPDDGLWPPGCDSIRAVAFPAHGKFKDIVVIGNCEGARDEQAQPLVYRGGPHGFALDADLSTELMGVTTVAEVALRMRRATATPSTARSSR